MEQMFKNSHFFVIGFLIACLVLLTVACNDGDETELTSSTATHSTAITNPYADLKGNVKIDGSSTVFPVTEAVAEEFSKIAKKVRVTVGVSGTGGGFKKFCSGETDISDASRPIKENEVKLCSDAGVEYIEVLVALDGLAVVTSKDNTFLGSGVTKEQLEIIFGAPSENTIMKWNQVDASWPDDDIDIYAPDTDSGTFDFFNKEITEGLGGARADYTASTDDNVLVTGVTGRKNTIGYFGYAYYIENIDKLQVVPVDGVIPSNATVADGSYALSRPLFIYVRADSLREKPQVRQFVRYYLSEEIIPLVVEVGYTGVTEAEIEVSRALIETTIKG